MALRDIPDSLSLLRANGDEISLLSSFVYCIFAVEGCLELAALNQAVDENRAAACSFGRQALFMAVCILHALFFSYSFLFLGTASRA